MSLTVKRSAKLESRTEPMITFAILIFFSGLCFGIMLGVEIWQRTVSPSYDQCIDDLLAANRRLRLELSRRDKTVEGDEWKDG